MNRLLRARQPGIQRKRAASRLLSKAMKTGSATAGISEPVSDGEEAGEPERATHLEARFFSIPKDCVSRRKKESIFRLLPRPAARAGGGRAGPGSAWHRSVI